MKIELKYNSQKEVDNAVKKLNKMVRASGVLEVIHKKTEFLPKSTRLKRKREHAAKQRRMDEVKERKRKFNENW